MALKIYHLFQLLTYWNLQLIKDGKPQWNNQTPTGPNKLGPSPTRGRSAAVTYTGIGQLWLCNGDQMADETKNSVSM